MEDAVVILMTLGFFALAVAYVALCDRIIGPDPDPGSVEADTDEGRPGLGTEAVTR